MWDCSSCDAAPRVGVGGPASEIKGFMGFGGGGVGSAQRKRKRPLVSARNETHLTAATAASPMF